MYLVLNDVHDMIRLMSTLLIFIEKIAFILYIYMYNIYFYRHIFYMKPLTLYLYVGIYVCLHVSVQVSRNLDKSKTRENLEQYISVIHVYCYFHVFIKFFLKKFSHEESGKNKLQTVSCCLQETGFHRLGLYGQDNVNEAFTFNLRQVFF